jgi:Tol biopolymer transport system component
MAHRSARSPDGQWVVIVEMDEVGRFTPCRLVPWASGSAGRLVGPVPGRCTTAAWAPDGRWMYFTADTGEGFHVWRQRFPDGTPEQVTAGGTTEEVGLAVAADGRSLITSVGQQKRGVWIHDASGERQVSLEGYVFWPLFSANRRTLCFRVTRSAATGQTPSELWMTDLDSGRVERLLPGMMITQYDLSRDDRLVASVREADGKARLWLASLDGREPPRRLGNFEAISPRFGANGEIYFLASDGGSTALFRTDDRGTRERIASQLMPILGQVSPDGSWVSVIRDGDGVALPTGGGSTVAVLRDAVARLRWSPDGTRVLLQVQAGQASAFGIGRTYVLPLDAGSKLPRMPPGGFRSEAEIAAVPGVEILPYGDLAVSPAPGVYAFSKVVTTRNLYRVPLR